MYNEKLIKFLNHLYAKKSVTSCYLDSPIADS